MKSWEYGINSLPEYRYGTIFLIKDPWWLSVYFWFVTKIIACDSFDEHYDWYHTYICVPLHNYYFNHPKHREIAIEVGYDRVKELFGEEDAEFFLEEQNVDQD